MLYDFISTDRQSRMPLYQQVYLSIRQAIENGSLKKGSRLPSVRQLSRDRGISKTTVLGAYDQLCVEGYIVSRPQTGYFVAAAFDSLPQAAAQTDKERQEVHYAEFDFSGKSIDESVIDLSEWKKCVKDVINRNYLLTSYGDAQGEEALRTALQKYALGTRSVNFGKKIAVERGSFLQAELVFESFDYRIAYFDSDRHGVLIDSLKEISPDLVLINPNCTGTHGGNMPVTRRLELIEWARETGALILEDDYNGELRYSTLPIPCVQHYDVDNTVYIGSFSKVLLPSDVDNTVYIGSFSKVLLPSVRLSYMVLPQRLLTVYNSRKGLMNQTASKTEQLALAKYIENRRIDAHLRRARRVYYEKSKRLMACVEKTFPSVPYEFNETALYLVLKPPFSFDRNRLEQALAARSVRLMARDKEKNALALSFSGIPLEKTEEGVRLIGEALTASR